MTKDPLPIGSNLLLRGAALWLIMALILAWCLVGLGLGLPLLKEIFQGKYTRLLQAHLDFLLMSALILGIYAAKVPLPWHVRWAIVVGAFTNSSLFLLQAVFPALESPAPAGGILQTGFIAYAMASLTLTSYGFGRAAMIVLRSTIKTRALL